MADRSRRHGARHAFRVLLLTVAVFALWRVLGPSVAVVRDSSLAPILEHGDIVWIKPARGTIDHGAVVLVPPFLSTPSGFTSHLPFLGETESTQPSSVDGESLPNSAPGPDALVPRIAVGFSGDEVTWTDTLVTVAGSEGSTFRLSPETLHPILRQTERSVTIPESSVFTVSLSGGMVDSRLIGPRPARALRYEVVRIMWPRERRAKIELVESDRGASP